MNEPLEIKTEDLNYLYNDMLYNENQIAIKYNTTPSHINYLLAKHKLNAKNIEPEIQMRKLYIVKKKNNIYNMREYLNEEYINQQKSTVQIGRQINEDMRYVVRLLHIFDIPTRNRNEMKIKINSQNSHPTDRQFQVILASWLGDGNIRKIHKNPQLRITHCIEQYDYLNYKRKILEEDNLFWFNEYRRENKVKTKTSIRYNIESQNHSFLNDIYDGCYKDGKVKFSFKYINQITEFGLYIWYLDDGSLQQNSHIIISTDAFTENENIQIKQWLNDKWKIQCIVQTISKNGKDYFRLRFNSTNSRKFIDLISKYKEEVPCMLYKFNFNKQRKVENNE